MDKKKEMEMMAFLGIGGERLDELGQKAVDLGMTVEGMQEFSQLAIACGAVLKLTDDADATLVDLYDDFGADWLEQLGADE
ncbi:hypothetical protein [Enterococcus faecium]|uniref:hypothetical protein n=1 Tax=Enterococcus faecium TaxID=1352 RepID=UPI000330F527|nr:hypothetical protein [Enterococcus faecium]EOM66675.1 hypothetical protein SK9_01875 [Enterococcus faecium EnGen0163]